MWNWYTWLALGLVLFVFATIFTFLWWKIGDQWADAEYKKFGHGGGQPADTSNAKVIKPLETSPTTIRTEHAEPGSAGESVGDSGDVSADQSISQANSKVSPD